LEPPSNADEINTSLTYGFVFDLCGVEIDPVTMQVRVDRYITAHDAGKLLNPLIAEGQIHGAFVQGLATALYEEFIYDDQGAFLTGTFADYLVPTATEVPEVEILHTETPSPFTPLGAKGLAEGNCMSTPVCIANAVADALGIVDVPLPITPDRVNGIVAGDEPAAPAGVTRVAPAVPAGGDGRTLRGSGGFIVKAQPAQVWASLLDPEALRAVIPGCHSVTAVTPTHFKAEVSLGVGPIKGKFSADVRLSDLKLEEFAHLAGALTGPLGEASGEGDVRLIAVPEGCRVEYDYSVNVTGKVAAVGGRMLDRATEIVIGKFFERLASHVGDSSAGAGGGGSDDTTRGGWLKRLFGGRE
jgi:2-furoyl-CoA dehydrogenase large subunit